MEVLVLSDLHGNFPALKAVMERVSRYAIERVILLGDLIDYGQHSNEVVDLIQKMPYPVVANIRGNHEQAILSEDYTHFSSERGRLCAQYTRKTLSENTRAYLQSEMDAAGMREFELDGKSCLAVHGSLEDVFWKSITPETNVTDYRIYDYVFSGHSHRPHCFEVFFEVDNPTHRNQKKTTFINPGSVGQPRNLNPCAQFAVLDTGTGTIHMEAILYDIKKAQDAYHGQVDDFYRRRLKYGI